MNIDQIPMLPGRGLLGHMTLFREDPVGFLRSLAHGGDMFRLDFVVGTAVVVTSPALLQEALLDRVRSFEKTTILRYLLQPVLGDGIFLSRDEDWRRQRRMMAPFLQPAQIAHHAERIVRCTQRAVATFRDGCTVDMLREANRISMAITSQALFGLDTFLEADDVSHAVATLQEWAADHMAAVQPLVQGTLSRSLERLGERLPGRAGSLARQLGERLHGPLLLFGEESRRVRAAIAVLDRSVQRLIDEKRTAPLDPEHPDLLGRLLTARDEAGRPMSDKQLRDQLLTFLIAGFETTGAALVWSLYLLLLHPDSYRRAQAEADALGPMPQKEVLLRLDYPLRVFKEALRLYPPSAIFSREAYARVTIGGHELPTGTILFMSPYATQHRADLWPEPERFDPERFLPAEEEKRSRYAYLPFGAGPRICIGMHLALLEGALVLATLLRQVDLELATKDPVLPEFQATLRPAGSVLMRIRRRGAAG